LDGHFTRFRLERRECDHLNASTTETVGNLFRIDEAFPNFSLLFGCALRGRFTGVSDIFPRPNDLDDLLSCISDWLGYNNRKWNDIGLGSQKLDVPGSEYLASSNNGSSPFLTAKLRRPGEVRSREGVSHGSLPHTYSPPRSRSPPTPNPLRAALETRHFQLSRALRLEAIRLDGE
jgi:hypothetical protein